MGVVPEIHASRLLAKTVVDNRGRRLGRVTEIFVQLGKEELPPVVALQVQASSWLWRGPLPFRLVPWRCVQVLVRQYLSLSVGIDSLPPVATPPSPPPPVPSEWLPVRRTLFDKQIVDLNGLRVVRVNDVKFTEIGDTLRLVAVDVGLRGLLRRLGLRPLVHFAESHFGLRLPDTLIRWQDVQRIELEGNGRLHLGVPYERLARLRPADLADILEALHTRERTALLGALDPAVAAETLTEVEPEAREQMLARLTPEHVLRLLQSLSPDDAAAILSELRADRATALLGAMHPEQGEQVRALLEYPEDTAGRFMSTDFMAFPRQMTADETIATLRRLRPPAEEAYYLYVIDDERHLLGTVSLRDLVIAPPEQPLGEIMHPNPVAVRATDDRRTVGELLAKYDLLALPVIDEDGRLVGVVALSEHADEIFRPARRGWWRS
ncbi:MAG TPA: CBS domain-containing protein [Firmicutes bacterium]|nr:CBS domain-containing protein [Bacillota bacterium]